MPKINGKFVGYEYPNELSLQDTTLYTYNKFGHRCKDVENIDLDNYILFTGCSHTLGEALNVEHTYPYLAAQALNCDYYNLGIPASGLDLMIYNLLIWNSTYKPPKAVVIQYPDYTRFSALARTPLVLPYGPWSADQDALDILMKSEEKNVFALRNFFTVQLINSCIKVPVVKLVFGSTKSIDPESIRIQQLDLASDNKHFGVETHLSCSEIVVDKISKYFI